MPRPSPLEDPVVAAHAWARFRRVLRWMMLVTVALVVVALKLVRQQAPAASVHAYIAVALGVAFVMLLTSALMGLVFLSSGTGHDQAVDAPEDPDQPSG